MQEADAFPVQVMEPSLHEWPLGGSQQGARSRYSSDYTAGNNVQNFPGR